MSWTQKEVDELIAEFEKDLQAYQGAVDFIQRRRLEVEDSGHSQHFNGSSGCQAVSHVLVMNISRTEGIIEDLKMNRDKLPADRPSLKLVENGVCDGTNDREE
jgi:hypothetical protein